MLKSCIFFGKVVNEWIVCSATVINCWLDLCRASILQKGL